MAKKIFTDLNLLWNELQNAVISGYVSDEELTQILLPIRSSLQEVKQRLDYIIYSKRYDLTDPNLSDDLQGDYLSYDNTLLLTKNNGNFTINVPRTSSYYLYLHIKNNPNATYITANNIQYTIQEEMTLKFDNVNQLQFSSDNYIWLSEISVTEYKLPDVPTKLSQLENDQEFVASKVMDDTLILTVK